MMMRTSQAGRSLVTASEGKHYAAYLDGADRWTGGIGHLLKPDEFTPGETFTESKIQQWFDEDIAEAEYIVRKYIKVPLTQGMFDALVSFAFNFGEKKFASYSLKDLINGEEDANTIAAKWMEYVYTINDRDRDGDQDAVIDRGLPIRRLREWLVYKGFSWSIAEAAANENNIRPAEKKIPWRNGGFKEVMTNVDDFVQGAIERARGLAAFMDEPDDDLFKDDELVIPDPPSRQAAREAATIPEPPPIPPHYEEPELMPAPKPVNRPTEPFQNYDPENAPKDIAFSKRVHGLFLVIMGWMTLGAEALAGLPFVAELAAMSPLQVTDWRIGLAILMAGLLLHWYGKVKARGPLK